VSNIAALAVPAVIGVAVLAVIVAAGWLLGRVAEAIRGRGTPAPVPPADECRWCRKIRYSDIAIGPQHCTCTEACGVMWCQLYPVTRS
jgi:hypothetical protein